MYLVLNVPEFWLYQGSEYASGFEYTMILNIPEFWICQGYTGFRICLNNSWICLNMPDYVWIFLNMSEYGGICMDMPKSSWIAFALHFPITLFVLQCPFSLNTWLLIWTSTGDSRGYGLKEHETFFLKKQNLFFYSSCKYFICFCFRLNIFKSKFYISCYLSRPSGGRGGDWGPWILIHSSMVLFFLSQNL